MSKRKITAILSLAAAFCFFIASLVQAQCLTATQALNGLENSQKAVSIPIWKITQDGTSNSVKWVDHAANPRFAIYNAGTPQDESDDLVLDKETGLVWVRDATASGEKTWHEAINYCYNLDLGNRKGWRLPTVEELLSLLDTVNTNPALPSGHPFYVQVDIYWSSTTYEVSSGDAWIVSVGGVGGVGAASKTNYYKYVWPVRGSNGYATGDW
jgi:hypothetical protein